MKRGPLTHKLPRDEVAAIVAEALKSEGIDAILTGGSVVSIYTDNEYESWDLDFITPGLARSVENAMTRIGFRKTVGRHFTHPDTPFHVEFPGSVPTVGREVLKTFSERVTSQGPLKLLTPTDSIKDRLAAYVHWNDKQCLEQAVAIAKKCPVNLASIARWAKAEDGLAQHREFLKRLKARR